MRGQWRNRQTTPPSLQPLVEHGMQFVNEGRRQLFEETLTPLRAKYGADNLQRVEQCLRIFVGEMEPGYVDERQRPRLMYFPGLPTSPYLDRGLFPVGRKRWSLERARSAASSQRSCRASPEAKPFFTPMRSPGKISVALRRSGTAITSSGMASGAGKISVAARGRRRPSRSHR